jgi:glycosyltransferase involved in cell wall biosynthesis
MLKISIFTPTHNPKYLREAYESIGNQNFDEWIIVANNITIPAFGDSRVKVCEYNDSHYVGALKKFACEHCTGDILVELDHDDLLMDNAIEEIRKAFEDPEIGFVYSNTANFKDDYKPYPKFNIRHGWVHRDINYKGNIIYEHVAFEPTPAVVSRIWYAPNHVRAWRKEVYTKAGGHAEDMRVLDDQDLIARTYMITKFKHIDKCLYLYRVTGDNTWLKYNKEIQSNVYRLYDKYIYDLVARWSELEGLKKIDLGGRFNCPQGYISVDLKDAQVNCNLNERWPFEDNSIGVIRANDILEHLKDPIHIMKEAYRVLVPGGYFMIKVPSTDGRGAYQDPTHVSYWNENSFLYYTRSEQAKYIDTPVRFQTMRLYSSNPNEWCKKNYICYVTAHLIALKGNSGEPGIIEI